MLTKKQKSIIRKSKFYFIPDTNNLPRCTVCIIKENDHYARGIALCSLKTKFPDSEEGCFYAWKCAKRAIKFGQNNLPIVRQEAFEVISTLKSQWQESWEYRAQFDVLPENGIEKKIFKDL